MYVVVAKHTWATSVTDTVATPPKLSTTDGTNGKNPPEIKLKYMVNWLFIEMQHFNKFYMKFIHLPETEMLTFALKYSWKHINQTEGDLFLAGFWRLEPLCTSTAKFILTKTPLCQAIIFFHSEQFRLVKKKVVKVEQRQGQIHRFLVILLCSAGYILIAFKILRTH